MRPLVYLIPEVSDQSVREQALGVAALLFQITRWGNTIQG